MLWGQQQPHLLLSVMMELWCCSHVIKIGVLCIQKVGTHKMSLLQTAAAAHLATTKMTGIGPKALLTQNQINLKQYDILHPYTFVHQLTNSVDYRKLKTDIERKTPFHENCSLAWPLLFSLFPLFFRAVPIFHLAILSS